MNPSSSLPLLKRLKIKSSKLTEGLLTGEYKSLFQGQGVELKEVRPYQWGDDIRQIDWNVTARMGTAYVKELIEERELTYMAVLDKSHSMNFGTKGKTKEVLGLETASLLALLASSHQDQFGVMAYGKTGLLFSPPAKGGDHIQRNLKILERPKPGLSSLEQALTFLQHLLKRKGYLFLLSDFQDPLPQGQLKILSKKHEIFPLILTDPVEWELPHSGRVLIRDLETGEPFFLETSSQKIREEYQKKRVSFYQNLELNFLRLGIHPAFFSTNIPPLDSFLHFLNQLSKTR